MEPAYPANSANPGKPLAWADWLWLVLAGAMSSAWCLGAAAELGATFDEPVYMARGLDGWRRGTHAPLLDVGTMPLPADVATLPLYVYERWTGASFDFQKGDCSRPLFWARSTTLLFWWLLLFLAMRIGHDLAGAWGGRLAVAFLACDPNLLAHASLATTDIAAAAMFLGTAWSFARGRDGAAGRRIVAPGVWFGLALFTKASALVFGPIAWTLIEWQRRRERNAGVDGADGTRSVPAAIGWREFRRDVVRIGLIGVVIVLVLCGCDWEPERSFVRWAESLPEGQARAFWTEAAAKLKIFANAGTGIVKQIRHNLRGHSTYLLGVMDQRSLWYYYPVLYTIKIPEAWLALAGLLLVTRPRALMNWACIAAGGLALYGVTCRVQIGIRLMFPWIALGLVGLGAAVAAALAPTPESWGGRRRRVVDAVILSVTLAGVGWLIWTALWLWPDGLRYINGCWGGPERGPLLVSDSNFDWGQGLKELARWQRAQGIEELDIAHVGTDPLLTELPMRVVPLDQMSVSEMLEHTRGRWLAVSATWLHGAYIRNAEVIPYLRGLQPAARTSTFFLFDFTGRRANAGG